MSNAWKKYECPECGAEHYLGLNLELNPVNCGDCGEEDAVNEENFVQVEVYEGKVKRSKKPKKTFDTVEEYNETIQ